MYVPIMVSLRGSWKCLALYRMSSRGDALRVTFGRARVRSSRYGSTLKGKTGSKETTDSKGASTTTTTTTNDIAEFVASTISRATFGVTAPSHFSSRGSQRRKRVSRAVGFRFVETVSRTRRIFQRPLFRGIFPAKHAAHAILNGHILFILWPSYVFVQFRLT